MAKKQMTIEDLAVMVQKGFQEVTSKMATKQELNEFRKEFHDFQKDSMEEFDRITADIRDIKITLGPLVRTVAAMESQIQNLNTRVSRVERKTGLTR